MEFKKILGFKFAANLTLGIILFGGIIFTLGFGISLLIARQEVSKEVDGKVESQINYLESFVEGQLMRIEDAGYSLGGSLFGKAVRGDGTDGFTPYVTQLTGEFERLDLTMLVLKYKGPVLLS